MVVCVIDFQKASASTKNPFNPLGKDLRRWCHQELERAMASPQVDSVVLYGGDGGSFSVGADLTEFAQFMKEGTDDDEDSSHVPNLVELITAVEQSPKPVVAAIAGHALGGGLELALACHYRVADVRSQLGLPEVQVGVIPGAGGTQRLPRLIGVEQALNMIVTGKPVNANRALELGLIDAVPSSSQSLLECAVKWAEWAALMPLTDRRVGEQNQFNQESVVTKACDRISKTLPPTELGGEGLHAAVEAVRACHLPLSQGMRVESELFWKMLISAQGQARRHAAFMAVQSAQKYVDSSPAAAALSSSRHVLTSKNPKERVVVGVVGAGTMGSGIAQVLLQTGFVVYLLDTFQPALEKGVQRIHETLQQYVQQGRLDKAKAKQLQQALIPTSSLSDLAPCTLVVEAVIENMQVKQDIFTSLDKVTQPNCLMLSNTSTLDIDQMAAVINPSRRAFFAGWHFFSPAPVMKLVEIVRGQDTSSSTVVLLQALTKRLGKIGVIVGNCRGFVGNRMLHPYTSEMVLLLTEPGAATVASIDQALLSFGMALGPFQMSDLAGNDIGYHIRRERGWVRDKKDPIESVRGRRPPRYTELADDMVTELGRLGQKVGKGWYDYDPKVGKGRKPLPSSEMEEFIGRYTKGSNTTTSNSKPLSSTEVVERVLFPLVNEGFKILEEGIARQPSDVDVVYVYGYGWPIWRGGPMYWADHDIGLPRLLAKLQEFAERFPGSDYYVPSKLLQQCVAQNIMVETFYKRGLHKQASKQSKL